MNEPELLRQYRAFEHRNEDVGKHEARELFFHAVHKIEPHVSNDLMGEPLALYRAILREHVPMHDLEHQLGWGWAMELGRIPDWSSFEYARPSDPPQYHRLRELILRWGRRWRLGDSWCLQAAVETVASVAADSDVPQPRPLYYLSSLGIEIPFSDRDLALHFEDRGWIPTLESWQVAEDRIMQRFRRELQSYKARVEVTACDRGLVPPVRNRERSGDPFKWLARYVVARETTAEIAKPVGISRQAVASALRREAARIQLTIPDRQTPLRQLKDKTS